MARHLGAGERGDARGDEVRHLAGALQFALDEEERGIGHRGEPVEQVTAGLTALDASDVRSYAALLSLPITYFWAYGTTPIILAAAAFAMPISAPRARISAASVSGTVEPQSRLMLNPSGVTPIDVTVAPSSHRILGATR